MKVSRSEFAKGFELLGFIGLLVSAVVVPGQWISHAIRPEALVGIVLSAICVLVAVLLELSFRPALVVAARLFLLAGAGYLALTPFVAAELGWEYWPQVSLLALASVAATIVGGYGLWREKRRAAQLGAQSGGASPGDPAVSSALGQGGHRAMPRFRVVVMGTGMCIPPDGCTGFATTRFVRAPCERDAAAKAVALVADAVASESAFSSSPSPKLVVDQVARVFSPFKRSRPNGGFTFIGNGASLEDALHLERQVGAGWLL